MMGMKTIYNKMFLKCFIYILYKTLKDKCYAGVPLELTGR